MKVKIALSLTLLATVLMAVAQPVITQQPTNQVVVAGGTATFCVSVSGTGPFTYQWLFNGAILSQTIITVAGNGTNGYSGDGVAATRAALYWPYGVAVDSLGNLYIADYLNNRIRKVGTNGIISTMAGNGNFSYSGDGGAATSTALYHPNGVTVDTHGNLYIADVGNQRIRKWERMALSAQWREKEPVGIPAMAGRRPTHH